MSHEGVAGRLEPGLGGLAWGLMAVWTALVVASLLWNLHQARETALELARTEAKLSFNKDLAHRLWAASHGGVYVPVTPEMPPNPYLSHLEERDIRTPSGRVLTLVNPAYMTRQVHELAAKLYGARGHLTSLKPIRPENAPDAWEAKALKAFETGAPEIFEVVEFAGEPHIRLMRPMRTEKECLKCHAAQGYQEGDIRGGISVDVPLKPYLAGVKAQTLPLAAGHGLIWMLGLAGIFLAGQRIRRHLDDRQRAEEALRQRTSELEVANRELEAFSYSVSHDLKAPVRAIQGYSRILTEEHAGKLDEEGLRFLDVICNNTRLMAQLIDDLLTLSRLGRQEVKKSVIDLAAISRQAFEQLRAEAPDRDLELRVQELPPAWGDPNLITQVLLNLLGNAIKYTKPRETAVIEVGGRVEDQETVYYVQDNGIGFDARYVDQLFGVFQRLHGGGEYEGTGVGLAIVKRIVQRHGGRVWAEGQENAGATFYFALPRSM